MARVSRGFGLLALGFGCAFVGVAPAGAPGAAPRERSLRSLVQRQADASMLQPYGPVVAYAKAGARKRLLGRREGRRNWRGYSIY